MSLKKKHTVQGMGMSLQMIQKPTLIKCGLTCEECYNNAIYPDGFFCPQWKVKVSTASPTQKVEREKIYPDDVCL